MMISYYRFSFQRGKLQGSSRVLNMSLNMCTGWVKQFEPHFLAPECFLHGLYCSSSHFVALSRKLQQFHWRVPATGERFLLPAWPTRPHLHAFPAQSCRKGLQVTWYEIQKCRGRILGRNIDKSLGSFPPCYSQSTLKFRREISISSNSRNLLQFL